MRKHLSLLGAVLFLGMFGVDLVWSGEAPPTLFTKFCGRVSIQGLRANYPNPAGLLPENEDCTNGMDDDVDGAIDFADPDCQTDLGPQFVFLKTPFKVVEAVGGFAAARYTTAKRSGDPVPLAELLINTTGKGGRKLSYLRTTGRDTYTDVSVRALIIPGGAGDNGGPVALRIQAAGAPNAGKSYYLAVVPGGSITIEKDNGDGTSTVLATAAMWSSGDPIDIVEYDAGNPAGNPCYDVQFTAVGAGLTATVTEVDCHQFTVESNRFRPTPVEGRTVSLNATDSELASGFIGLRSDNDPGLEVVDDIASAAMFDPSVLEYIVSDPNDTPLAGAPRVLFFHGSSASDDANLNYTTNPITTGDDNTYNRSLINVADTSLASYLRSLGFNVTEYNIASLEAGILTPAFINANFDLFWLPSSGGGGSNRPHVGRITIPFIFAEHVVGRTAMTDGAAGLWAGTGNLNGNENQVNCGTTVFTATLNGAQEAPNPVDTPASGFGVLPYNEVTNELSFNIEFSGLVAPESAAHIHMAPAGVAGGVIHGLPAGNPKVGSVMLSDDEEAALLASGLYVNIHSTMHPMGEIRGQIVPGTISLTKMRVIPEDNLGDPEHPIIRGLADGNGDIEIYDSAQIPLNTVYDFPGPAIGISGAGFASVKAILDARGWGPGHRETQFAGYPPTEGGFALTGTVNPCTDQTFWSVDETGALNSADGRGHIALMVAEAGTPRLVDGPANCPTKSCAFDSRVVFYGVSDRAFPFATPALLKVFRRMALWSLNLLDSPNRTDTPFQRGDANADGNLDISDPVTTLNFLFVGGATPTCLDASDTDDNEVIEITDPIISLNFLFTGGPPPRAIRNLCFQGCALDFTPAPSQAEQNDPDVIVSCEAYGACRS
jgi:hypothetical protein